MKKHLLLCALALLCSEAAFGQTAGGRYRFDNFDMASGVRVEVPAPPKPAVRPRRVRLTARSVETRRTPAPVLQPSETPAPLAAEPVYRPRHTAMTVSRSLDGFSTGDATIDALIVESGTRNGVDPVLLYAIMHRESSFKRHAVSHKGARGLMQLMPATAARFGVRNIFEPRQNIEGGTRYMRFLLDLFDGDVRLALAGYNAGEGAVMKYGRRVPPYSETQEYVRRITQRYAMMRDPQTARVAPRLTRTQIATIKTTEKPLSGSLYERNVYAVRLPDGKLRLVSH